MSDILDTQPPALPSDIARVYPDTGKPTAPQSDYEAYQASWFGRTVVDLSTRITTVQQQADGNTAAITNEAVARAEGDEALAEAVETVTTTVAGNTAAITTLSGSYNGIAARYTVQAALNYSTGSFELTGVQRQDGSGPTFTFAIRANEFFLTDPSFNGGLPGNVLSYSYGAFRFGVPVIFDTAEIEYNAVNTIQAAALSSAGVFGSDGGGWHDVIVLGAAGGAGAYAVITLTVSGSIAVNGSGGSSNIQMRVISDATGVQVIPPFTTIGAGNTGYEFSLPGPTNYRFQVRNQTTGGSGRTLTVDAGTQLVAEVRFR